MAKQQSSPYLIRFFAIAVLVAALVGIWKIPQIQVGLTPLKQEEKNRIDAETAARLALIQGVGGLLLLGTAAISFLNLRATQRNVEIAQKNALIAEEKQVTERFSKAMEMLGNENSIHIRLGGIYALERIANDSDKDYWQVMEVLTAYVRERSPWKPQSEQELSEDESDPSLPVDIQAVLTVVKRRKHYYGNGEKNGLNFSETDLRRADFKEAKLQGANFEKANLERADLSNAELQGACFDRAALRGTDLMEAKLQGADLMGVKLQWAFLRAADLQDSDLRMANLQGADLIRANLQRANFMESKLQKAILFDADLQEAQFLTWEHLKQAESYEGAQLPDYLIESQPPTPEK